MIASLVQFASNLSDDEVQAIFEERADQYRKVPGLLQKTYLRFRASGKFGALYLWDSEESMARFRETALARSIPDAYQVVDPPRSEIADVCLIVEPAASQSA